MAKIWTVGDHTHPVMIWSMYGDDSYKAFDKWDEDTSRLLCTQSDDWESPEMKAHWAVAYEKIQLDTTIPPDMEDGIYRFFINYPVRIASMGVAIKDGQFDPLATSDAICRAINLAYGIDDNRFDHIYIEKLQWDGIAFNVSLGS